MKRLTHILLILTTLTAVGLATVLFKDKWDYRMADPQIPQAPQGLITEISMNVYNDWCGGLKCPDYEITFRREGRVTCATIRGSGGIRSRAPWTQGLRRLGCLHAGLSKLGHAGR